MPKPQGDVGGICTCLQQAHGGRVTDHVRRYRQLAQFRVASRGRRDGKLKNLSVNNVYVQVDLSECND
jgi:hypothetical protein